MNLAPGRLGGLWLIDPSPIQDNRGFLARTYCESIFTLHNLNTRWVQHNHTQTKLKGSIRGLHWQEDPQSEIKLVRCLAGSILDVAVDLRTGSPTFGRWQSVELSARNMRSLYIPKGFAHGFQCLEDNCHVFYLMSDFYSAQHARGMRYDDKDIAIKWPLKVTSLSDKDAALPFLNEIF